MIEKCIGCGSTIQTNDPKMPGYITKSVLLKHKEDCYCERCFSLRHYNRNVEYEFNSKSYQSAINEVKKDNGLIVHVIDFFDLEGTIIPDVNKIFNSDNILIVANKVDLFLNSLNINKATNYLRQLLNDKKIKFRDIILVSSFKQKYIVELMDIINELRDHKNVYFVGMTNVGKSSLINHIIKMHVNADNLITVSNSINTTLSNIHIPLDNDSFLVDTPGIINEESIINFLDKSSLEKITPKTYIKPKTFQLNPEQSLFIAGFLRIDFIEGTRSSLTTNFNNDLLIHRTKLINADEFYEKHVDDLLQIPNEKERKTLGASKTREVNFSPENKIDIVVNGLGYITANGEGKLIVKTFKNIKVSVRKAIL